MSSKKRQTVNIINKRGDLGKTSLYSADRVSKSSLLIDALGDLDELQSVLGLARFYTKTKKIKLAIYDVQRNLFTIGSELATPASLIKTLPRRVDSDFLNRFENIVQKLHDETPVQKGFSIPGKVLSASYINHARTIARRLERKVVKLFEKQEISNKNILAWLNRLSVYLYLMTRFEDKNPDLL